MNKPTLQEADQGHTKDQVETNSAMKGPDPFDIDKLVLTQSFAEAVGAEEVINKIVVRKPNKQEWYQGPSRSCVPQELGLDRGQGRQRIRISCTPI